MEDEDFFKYYYNAQVTAGKQTFRHYNGFDLSNNGLQPVQGTLQVVEEPSVNIIMPVHQYKLICQQLADLYKEEDMRFNDPTLYDLYIQYKLWMELKR